MVRRGVYSEDLVLLFFVLETNVLVLGYIMVVVLCLEFTVVGHL